MQGDSRCLLSVEMTPLTVDSWFPGEPQNRPWTKASYLINLGFSRQHSGKESSCQCRRRKGCRFSPRVRKIPWRRAWLHYILAWKIARTEEPARAIKCIWANPKWSNKIIRACTMFLFYKKVVKIQIGRYKGRHLNGTPNKSSEKLLLKSTLVRATCLLPVRMLNVYLLTGP